MGIDLEPKSPSRPSYIRDHAGRFGNQISPLPDKIERDAQRLQKLAHWVLVIDEQGNVCDLIENQSYVANVIAVLGPAVYHDTVFQRALLLEIGISQGRPYMQAESHRLGGRMFRKHIKGRTKVTGISFTQLKSVWPMLISIIEELVKQARSRWQDKNKGGWYVFTKAGFKCFERGICFSVSRMDDLLCEAFLLRDVEVRKYLYGNAWTIGYFLRRYKYAYYPEKQLKSLAGVRKVVDLWKTMSTSPRWSKRYSRRILGILPSKTRSLFKQIASVYNLDVAEELEHVPIYSQARQLVFPAHLHVRLDGDGKVHGRGCSVFEVTFSKLFRETNGV